MTQPTAKMFKQIQNSVLRTLKLTKLINHVSSKYHVLIITGLVVGHVIMHNEAMLVKGQKRLNVK